MKKVLVLLLLIVGLLVFSGLTEASGAPYRHSTEVTDVSKPYEAQEWIVSPTEEPKDDQTVSNARECDIQGVISCYDQNYLRVDILLNYPISYKWATWYTIKLEYEDKNEYYTYYTDTKELIFEKEKEGKVVETKTLSKDQTYDWAGVTNTGDVENGDVYFIINKEDHIGGTKGNKYYLTCSFLSGYISDKEESHTADETIQVDLEFGY